MTDLNRIDRISDRWIALGLGLYSLGIAMWMLGQNVRAVMVDDGFYYFKIAQSIAQGRGSTFDGFHPTNGYHPLWLLCLVPAFWLTSTPDTALMLGAILEAIFMAVTTALVYYTARLTVEHLAASLAALTWVLFVYQISLNGLETSLYALGMVATAYVYLRWFVRGSPLPAKSYLALGLLLSLTFLARLDAILLACFIGLFLAYNEFKKGLTPSGFTRLLAFSLPVVLACLVYSGINLFLFGHLLTVSNVVKRTWSAYWLGQDPHYLKQGWLVAKVYHLLWPLHYINYRSALAVALGTFGVGSLWLVGVGERGRHSWAEWLNRHLQPWEPFIGFSLISFLSYGLLYHGTLSLSSWYYVVQPWLAGQLVAMFFNKLVKGWGFQPVLRSKWLVGGRWLFLAGLIGFWASLPLYTAWTLRQWQVGELRGKSPFQPLLDMAQWVSVNLPPDAVIGSWNAGAIGYLSGRRVVDLDGVVNSWAYYQTERYDLCRYWQEAHITYLADVFEGGQALSSGPTYPYYMRCVNRLELIWTDNHYGASWHLAVYRIRLPADHYPTLSSGK